MICMLIISYGHEEITHGQCFLGSTSFRAPRYCLAVHRAEEWNAVLLFELPPGIGRLLRADGGSIQNFI